MKLSSMPLRLAFSAVILVIGLAGGSAFGQTTTPDQNTPDPQTQPAADSQPAPAAPINRPLIESLEKITIGMPYAEVKKVLGKPDVEDDRGGYFTPTKTHSIQIGLDSEKKVRTIASMFTDGDKQAPSIAEVLGTDASAETGDVYKIERYDNAGIWIAYSRTNSKDKPMTVITMRKVE